MTKTHEECMKRLREIPLRTPNETIKKEKEYRRNHLPNQSSLRKEVLK